MFLSQPYYPTQHHVNDTRSDTNAEKKMTRKRQEGNTKRHSMAHGNSQHIFNTQTNKNKQGMSGSLDT